MKPRFPCLTLLFLLAATSCEWGPLPATQAIGISLPASPESRAFLGRKTWTLSWRDGEGRARTTLVEEGGRAVIEVARGLPQSIMASQGEGGGAGLRYPGGLGLAFEGGGASFFQWDCLEVSLDWREGWLAEVCVVLESWGLEPEAFNLERLRAELGAAQADPWFLPPRKAAALLAEGRFRSSFLEPPVCHEVHLPGPGPWAPESPLGPAPKASGSSWAVSLPAGTWLFLGAAEDLCVELRPGEDPVWARLPRGGG